MQTDCPVNWVTRVRLADVWVTASEGQKGSFEAAQGYSEGSKAT